MNPSKAVEHYTKAIERNPNDTEAYNNRGIAYRKLSVKIIEKANADFDKAKELGWKD